MRYDTPVYFQKITPGKYDPSTGNYGDDTVEETLRYASVMNTGEDQLRLVYDGPKQGKPDHSASEPLYGAIFADPDWREDLPGGFFPGTQNEAYIYCIGGAVMGIKLSGAKELKAALARTKKCADAGGPCSKAPWSTAAAERAALCSGGHRNPEAVNTSGDQGQRADSRGRGNNRLCCLCGVRYTVYACTALYASGVSATGREILA